VGGRRGLELGTNGVAVGANEDGARVVVVESASVKVGEGKPASLVMGVGGAAWPSGMYGSGEDENGTELTKGTMDLGWRVSGRRGRNVRDEALMGCSTTNEICMSADTFI